MRILVSADIHLGSPIRSVALRNRELGDRLKQVSRDTFVSIVDLAITEKVDALVLAGDIFDNAYPDLKSRFFLLTQLTRASQAGIRTFLIRGNHDALLDHNEYGDLGKNIHLLHRDNPTVELEDTAFHGLSFDKAHVSESFLPDYPSPVHGKRNVGLMHTSLDGSRGHDPYAPCAERDLLDHGYDLWCLGHIHAPFERLEGAALAVMPGIPQPRHFGERHGGTVTLVSLDRNPPTYERYLVGKLGFTECTLDLTDCSDQQAVINSLGDVLLSIKESSRDMAVRMAVYSNMFSTSSLTVLADQVLEDIEGVFIDKIKIMPLPQQSNEATDDLVRLMNEEIAEEGFRQLALQQLKELRDVLPAEIRDELDEEKLDALLQEAMNEIALTLYAGESL